MPDSPFRRLARTHALMAMGDASMYGALAGSVLFNLSPDAQREKVLLYLLVSVAPFAVVAPAIISWRWLTRPKAASSSA